MELRFKECPGIIIEKIVSKLDENNYEESKIKELWKENEIQIKGRKSFEYILGNKLNNIISKLKNKEYYSFYDFKYN
jgi:hypothetical protein